MVENTEHVGVEMGYQRQLCSQSRECRGVKWETVKGVGQNLDGWIPGGNRQLSFWPVCNREELKILEEEKNTGRKQSSS